MSREFRIAVGILVVIVAIGIDWALDDDDAPRSRRERRVSTPREPAVARSEPQRAARVTPRSLRRAPRKAAPDPDETPDDGEETEVFEPPPRTPQETVARVEGEGATQSTGAPAAAEAATREPWDGNLGRASLKSPHLSERSRVTLGGGDLRDLNDSVVRDPPPPLGAASLPGGTLRESSRESLGGGDLRDLEREEGLGAKSLGGTTLQDLSRDEDGRGDLADRSGR